MKISMLLSYAGGFKEAVAEVVELEKAGLDQIWVPEAYSFDAPSAMGYLAAKTERVTIASGILPIYSRTPTLLAMTAAGCVIEGLPLVLCGQFRVAALQLFDLGRAGRRSFPAMGTERRQALHGDDPGQPAQLLAPGAQIEQVPGHVRAAKDGVDL